MARIVVADDDPKQAELIRRYAAAEGHRVVVVHDGRDAVDTIRLTPPDLLILDVMMPRLNGFDVCRIVRTSPGLEQVSIMMLTARSGEHDLIDGLDVGADDYMAKPFSPRELMARIRALLRRNGFAGSSEAGRTTSAGSLSVDPRSHRVLWRGEAVDCTPGEFDLVEAMVAEPDRVFTRDALLHHLHGLDAYVSRRTVDVHIANIRKKIAPDVIRTIHGVGYSLGASS